MPSRKTASNENRLALARSLHSAAVTSRAVATDMDQMAGKIEREVRNKPPFPCCPAADCMICGAKRPSGHAHILLPGSRQHWQLPIGRICSSHTLLEITQADKFLVYIEGESDE